MPKNSYHVIVDVDGGWRVLRRGASRATRIFETQKEAIEFANDISLTHHADLVIHDNNGRPKEKRVYSEGELTLKE